MASQCEIQSKQSSMLPPRSKSIQMGGSVDLLAAQAGGRWRQAAPQQHEDPHLRHLADRLPAGSGTVGTNPAARGCASQTWGHGAQSSFLSSLLPQATFQCGHIVPPALASRGVTVSWFRCCPSSPFPGVQGGSSVDHRIAGGRPGGGAQ